MISRNEKPMNNPNVPPSDPMTPVSSYNRYSSWICCVLAWNWRLKPLWCRLSREWSIKKDLLPANSEIEINEFSQFDKIKHENLLLVLLEICLSAIYFILQLFQSSCNFSNHPATFPVILQLSQLSYNFLPYPATFHLNRPAMYI